MVTRILSFRCEAEGCAAIERSRGLSRVAPVFVATVFVATVALAIGDGVWVFIGVAPLPFDTASLA
ncbi:hypothetical protein DDA93_07965 [Arthrobacter sp. Bz4]|nr:hypothetical protein DDA93_07965 [Arthrobacter sp. Bz4]